MPDPNERFYADRIALRGALAVTNQTGPALGANATIDKIIDGDPDKEWWITHIGQDSTGDFTISLKNSDDDAFMTKNAVHNATLLGPLDRAGMLPRPIRIKPRGQLTVTIVDLSGAVNTIDLSFIGYRRHADCPVK